MSDLMASPVILGAFLVCAVMFMFWLSQVFTGNAGVIDIGWALALAVLAGLYAWRLDGYFPRKMLIASMVVIWAVRLSWLLVRRMLRTREEDERYRLLRHDWRPFINIKFFILFEVEAVLALVLSVPFFLICANASSHFKWVEYFGICLWVLAFAGEILADEQLHRFKSDPGNKGQVCQDGLWRYSRHPNYFFEWCIWVGYFLFALGSPYGWWGIVAPLVMLFLLTKVTGIPFAEDMALRSKGDAFREYQRTTSIFVPWLKMKRSDP